MSLPIELIAMVLAVVLLAYASDRFVLFATYASQKAGLSHIFTGVVVVGFGTGLPEFLTAILASLSHRPAVGVASAIGSTVINVTLVAGIAALAATPAVTSRSLRREGLVAVIGGIFLAAAMLVGASWLWGVLGIALFVGGVAYTLTGPREEGPQLDVEFLAHPMADRPIGILMLLSLAGLVGTLVGAEVFLQSAIGVATHFHLSAGFTGGVLISFGASLPELATALQAARRGLGAMVLGNVIGSSFFNSLMVASTAMVLAPGIPIKGLGLPALVSGATIGLFWIFMRSGKRLARVEGLILLAAYVIYLYGVGLG